jgi:hypothetical protein
MLWEGIGTAFAAGVVLCLGVAIGGGHSVMPYVAVPTLCLGVALVAYLCTWGR